MALCRLGNRIAGTAGQVEKCPHCGGAIVHGDGVEEPEVYCDGCSRTWPAGTIVSEYEGFRVWGRNRWGVPMVGLRLKGKRNERILTINEGGRGIILAVQPDFFYLCLWITARYNWRVSWRRETGWQWRDDDGTDN